MNSAFCAASFYKHIETTSFPNATSIPEATKRHHFTIGQISIFFLIAILIIAGIIALFYCFYLQKKNRSKFNVDIHDPFQTRKITNLPRYNDTNNIDSLNEIDDAEDTNDLKVKNVSNGINDSALEINNDTQNSNEVTIKRLQAKTAISLPVRTKFAPLSQSQKVNAADDFILH